MNIPAGAFSASVKLYPTTAIEDLRDETSLGDKIAVIPEDENSQRHR
jgi:hypothetical protein